MLQYSPKIITDSLVMCLDASNNKSYPTDLPLKDQLNLWLDAADDSTFSYSSGTTVSQWRDKSGQNNHAVVYGGSPLRSVAINSRKSVSFTSTSWFRCLTGNFTSTATHLVVCRSTTDSATYQRVYNGGSDAFVFIGALSSAIATFWGTGASWNDVNINAPTTTILNTLRIISAINTGAGATPYSNGTAMTVKSTNSAAYTGYGLNSSSGVLSQPLIGDVCEIIVFNKQLSTTELKQVHTYLGQKWGISNTDRSIVDLSNNNNHGLLGGLPGSQVVADMPLFDVYNKGALKLDGSTDYISVENATSLNPTTVTVSIWIKRHGYQSSVANYLRRNYNDAYSIIGDIAADNVRFRINNGSAYPESPNATLSLNEWTNIVGTYDLANIKIYKNGVFVNQTAHTSAISYASANTTLTIGRDDPVAGRYMNANYGSVLIYSRALSAAEVLQNYEAQKSKFANTIVQQGLVLNLDAGNPYSYAGAGSTWYDVSGNTKDFLIDGSGITYNSGGYFTLADGGITRSATITNSTTCTVVVWIRTTDTQALIFKGNSNGSFYLAAYNAGSGFYNDNCGSPTYWIDTLSVANPNPTYLDGNWHMWEMKNVNFSSWTSYEFNKYGSYTFGNGAVGQIMIYDRNLSSGESLQIYNATKGRFGL